MADVLVPTILSFISEKIVLYLQIARLEIELWAEMDAFNPKYLEISISVM